MTYESFVFYSLVALLILWGLYSYIMIVTEELVKAKQRRNERQAAQTRDHFRKTARFRDDF